MRNINTGYQGTPRLESDATAASEGGRDVGREWDDRFVRHPISFGVIVMSIAFALFVQGCLTLFEAVALTLFFDFKSRREEGCDVRDQN